METKTIFYFMYGKGTTKNTCCGLVYHYLHFLFSFQFALHFSSPFLLCLHYPFLF